MSLQIEIGGGLTPLGKPWINVDRLAGADVVLELDRADVRLPWADDEVDAVYSSHCFEHLEDYRPLLREIVRVLRPAGEFELRVPHWLHGMALCHGHRHTIAEEQVQHWTKDWPDYWFGGLGKGLFLCGTERIPSAWIQEAKVAFPRLSDEQLMKFVPNCCHELRFVLSVIER